jgi:acyl dehydratase
MALDPSYAGRVYPPTEPYEVGREKIREFADAIGDPSPVYRDREAAKAAGHPDVIAPPTFPIVVAMDASRRVIDDPELGLDFSRVVHGDQRFSYARPVCAGDELVATVTIASIKSVAGNDMITTSTDIVTVDGEQVVTCVSMLLARAPEA